MQLQVQGGTAATANPFRLISQVVQQEGVRSLYTGCSTLIIVCMPCLRYRVETDLTKERREQLPKLPFDFFHLIRSKMPYQMSRGNFPPAGGFLLAW